MSSEYRFALGPRPGTVHYTVADLELQTAFYTGTLGFTLLWRKQDAAGLGASDRELLRLTQVAGATRSGETTGLYHTAFLVPDRRDLAHLVRRIAETGTVIQGTADHVTHLAIYLPDPEGNGIELAWDFPRELWPMRDGKLQFEQTMRGGVDLQELLQELDPDTSSWTGLPALTRVGHVHLHVADLEASRHFYHAGLGLDETGYSERFGAAFFSAGGYHHHIGANIWQGKGAPSPPADTLGLRYLTIAFPDAQALADVRRRLQQQGVVGREVSTGVLVADSAQNHVLLTVDQDQG